MPLSISHVRKAFGQFAALDDVSLEVADGEFLALLGPSGSGKTTLLRILAGLESADAGDVTLDGQDFLTLSARQRRIGMVFQHYALFRHMTVAKNVAFGLTVRPRRERPSRDALRGRVDELLRLVQLEGLGDRYPAQLSGGQRQRVALARALAIEPRMLLLDEPFGALDAKVRRELRKWLRHVHDETGVTTLFVTHDQEEALDLADRVAILSGGKLQQVGAPQEVYDTPATAFVHSFLGGSTCLPGHVEAGRVQVLGWNAPAPAGAPTGAVKVCLRTGEIALDAGDDGIEARCTAVLARGGVFRVETRTTGGHEIDVERPAGAAIAGVSVGQAVRLRAERMSIYPAD